MKTAPALAALLACFAAPLAAHPETRSFLVAGDAEAVLIVTVPWAVTIEWQNRATLWTAEGPVALTYEGECGQGFDWRRLQREPGDGLLPAWLRNTAGRSEQHGHVGDFLCDGEYPAMLGRRMSAENAAARFRALVAGGVRPGPARAIAVAGSEAPGLVDALEAGDVEGSLTAVQQRARTALGDTR
ncbi:MAG: hypothetical protein ACSHW2_01995 [Parasphingopyxis sp.]